MGEEKVKNIGEIKLIAAELKGKKKIVTTNGSFDILHMGHVKTFYDAKEYGDVLIVGLNSDSSIKAYKSPNRPINNQKDRALMLAALEMVDYVVIFDELDPCAFLDVVKPDVHVKSKSGYKGIEKDTVEKNGGKVILLDDEPGYSTTDLIKRIIDAAEIFHYHIQTPHTT